MPIDVEIAAVHPRMGSPELPWPAQKTEQAAGWDCVAAINKPLLIWPGRLFKIPLGFALGLPEGWEAQVRPRSGLASQGLIMPNSPGTVDADYRGEVSAILFKVNVQYVHPADEYDAYQPDDGWLTIRPGDRICQLVIAPVPEVNWHHVPRNRLSITKRGEGGFGSTGL